ncbi:MAG: hypothetical protein QOH71_565 [Blastocatellia bacterium]|jgi:hypothetical protein|nr:hypothetical protein [Blastocatellia bacterium]
MALKISALVIGTLMLVGLGTKLSRDNSSQWENRHSIEAIVQRTKEQGKNKVTIPGPRIEYGGMNMTLREALQLYSVFIAEPKEGKSYSVDSNHIVTWYRFSIKETLSLRAPLVCNTCPTPAIPPPDIIPVKPGEFLISKVGGTVKIDGVEVTMVDIALPKFEEHKRYLMFVSLHPSGVALLGGGPTGVFQINDDDKLEALTKNSTRLQSEMRDRFDLNLTGFKAHAKP